AADNVDGADRRTIHVPGYHRSIVIAPQNVAALIAVEIARADDMPIVGGATDHVGGADRGTVHLPGYDRAGIVAPEHVTEAVAVEVVARMSDEWRFDPQIDRCIVDQPRTASKRPRDQNVVGGVIFEIVNNDVRQISAEFAPRCRPT